MKFTNFHCQFPTSRVAPHAHDGYECHFIVGGKGELGLGNEVIPVEPGLFFCIPPRARHHFASVSPERPLVQVFFEFRPDADDRSFIRDLSRWCPTLPPTRLEGSLLPFFERLKLHLASGSSLRHRQLECEVKAFLYSVMEQRRAKKKVPVAMPKVSNALVEELLEHLYAQIRGSFSVAGFARKAGVGQVWLIRQFTRECGAPPYAHYMRLKIEAARQLLLEKNASLSVVAETLGFSDVFHFGRVFKKVTGMPPGRWLRARG